MSQATEVLESPAQSPGLEPGRARDLASRHGVATRPGRIVGSITKLQRLAEYVARVRERVEIADEAEETAEHSKATEWLLDNHYLVQRSIRQVVEDMPTGFYNALPVLALGSTVGLPRIYAVASEALVDSELQPDLPALQAFVGNYQSVSRLNMGELWALPAMLRLATIEQLVRALCELAPEVAPVRNVEPAAQAEALDLPDRIGRCIRTLRTLNEIDWKAFFLDSSEVEEVLRRDPVGVYAHMDFDTSDRYRKVVERLARRTGRSEVEVASAAVMLARRAPSSSGRRSHVGLYLIGDGRLELETALGYTPSFGERWQRHVTGRPALTWVGGIVAATAVALALPCWYLAAAGAGPLAWIAGALLALIPASTIGVTVVQWFVTHTLPPRILPKMDFSDGIAAGNRTLVIVPSLLGSLDEAEDLVRQLEIHYTSNPDPELRFALLTDWCDAGEESVPGDDELLERAASGIEQLNARHGQDGHRPFHLLHRKRLWNPAEGVWMGWERKRGKLEELNALLAGVGETTFARHVGDEDGLRGTRYVITLDAGTIMPRDTAPRLVGILAHPLNRAELDPETGAVMRGYTVVQPRVEIAPEGGNLSRFTRVYGGDAAIDLYTLAVSDVYQDLAGCGIYVGKGIYDVAAFTSSLEHRVPENSLVSHDLFEGLHGRVGLASDVLLYEDYPPHYLAFVNRMHRWMRGDWQLLPWLGNRVPAADGSRLDTRFTRLGRWMVFDNLRRSLLTPALVLFLLAGWLWLPVEPALWTLLGLAAPAGHMFTGLVAGLIRGGRRMPLRPKAQGLLKSLQENLARWLFHIAFLPHEALVITDAVARTMWRVFVSRKNLLEWRTAAHTARSLLGKGPHSLVWSKMFGAPLVSLLMLALVAAVRPGSLPAALPLLLVWIASPEIARIASRPIVPRRTEPDAQQRAFLRRLARRTWLFYETFTGPEDNWLPPDNYQEDPGARVAHRTSPTNVGMLLTSTVSAHTLGYVGCTGLAFRLRSTLDTIERMERYRGHLYNWYDTCTLEPLLPRYVSSVDSGNLAASLLVVQQACAEAAAGPALRVRPWSCVLDTLALLDESAEGKLQGTVRAVRGRFAALEAADGAEAGALLAVWDEERPGLDRALLTALEDAPGDPDLDLMRERRTWLDRTHDHLRTMRREVEMLTPWTLLLANRPQLLAGGRAEIDEALGLVRAVLPEAPTLADVPRIAHAAAPLVDRLNEVVQRVAEGEHRAEALHWTDDLAHALGSAAQAATTLRDELLAVATRCEKLVNEHDFGLLYDDESHTFYIGHNVTENRTDPHHYDLLASEARIASLVSIGKGDVPTKHWFHLGRPLTRAAGSPALLSWSATMFEYMMPSLFAHSNERTLIAESCRAAVQRQIDYGARNGVPWGISESGFYAFDAAHNYQYRAFGCPGLGFKRGLEDDLVIAPYASALGLLERPRASCENLQRLEALGVVGPYGMYEAVDFTPRRMPTGRRHAVVKQYMAHHQGMILMAIEHLLHDAPAVRRFHQSPLVQTADLLLHERVPVAADSEERETSASGRTVKQDGTRPKLTPWVPVLRGRHPETHALSNGRLTTVVTDSGAGSTSWQGLALARWQPDAVLDDRGTWIYVRDEQSQALWSVGRGPIQSDDAECHVTFHPHMVELHRRDHGVFIRTEIAVAPGEDVEVRHVTVTNETANRRTLTLTSCAELALTAPGDDRRHPAFARLFAPATMLPERNALLFERRLRSPSQDPCAVLHRIVADEGALSHVGGETDRGRFLGRLSSWSDPECLRAGRRLPALSAGPGGSLDPLMSLSATITVGPFETVRLAYVTAVAGSRETVLEIGDRFRSLSSVEWVLQDAHAETGREAQILGLDAAHVPLCQALLSMLLQPTPALRGSAESIGANRLGRPALWGHGISGDLPILLCELRDTKDVQIVRQLLVAHHLWRRRGVSVALVFSVHGAGGYGDEETGAVHRLITECGSEAWVGRRGGVFVLRGDQMPTEDKNLLHATARVVLDSSRGTIDEQLAGRHEPVRELPHFIPDSVGEAPEPTPALERPTDLLLDNGLGGFSADGREYVVHLEAGRTTPAPWCNVIANPSFGTIVSESGLGYTWCENSAENRLTPWSNDPVSDPCGEVLYLRDEETAAVWSATPGPTGPTQPDTDYTVRHTAGRTTWLHNRHGLEHETRAFVAKEDPVKIVSVRLRNNWTRRRRLTLTFYAEWVLGLTRDGDQSSVIPEHDHDTGALLARNPWNDEHPGRVAFLGASLPPHGVTVDREEFLGRDGDRSRPAALERWGLSGRLQAGPDPCAALMVYVELEPGEEQVVWFVLGQGRDRDEAVALAGRYADRAQMEAAHDEALGYWRDLLGAVEVKTPEPAMDLVLNRWLLYEAVCGRLFARSGFYQSSGAFGFRDQLQDVLALALGAPELLREHILRAAESQFEEGDVLHWWHPTESGRRGVRTRCSDDLLWLPLAVAHYVRATGDTTLLDEEVPFLTAAPLADGEDERYERFGTAEVKWSVLEHCRRALEQGWTSGPHGLPLMGTCDWNDGLSRVGEQGRGESVWMGWFLHHVTHAFAALIEAGEPDQSLEWRRRAEHLRHAVETSAWDGNWYMRAWFDDGTPLGSSRSKECRIDAIAQSWAAISGAGDPERTKSALDSAWKHLVRADDGIVLLLTPPFQRARPDPGYIRSYPPGVRENGGQYTHAACWLGWAYAANGQGERAETVFRLLNPALKSTTADDAARYRVEPYVIAADVYGAEPHVGRGGWTWYTGAASWAWRLGTEAILGLSLEAGDLVVDPCIPPEWPGFEATVRRGDCVLHVRVENPDHVTRGVASIELDGEPLDERALPLSHLSGEHEAVVRLGPVDPA